MGGATFFGFFFSGRTPGGNKEMCLEEKKSAAALFFISRRKLADCCPDFWGKKWATFFGCGRLNDPPGVGEGGKRRRSLTRSSPPPQCPKKNGEKYLREIDRCGPFLPFWGGGGRGSCQPMLVFIFQEHALRASQQFCRAKK